MVQQVSETKQNHQLSNRLKMCCGCSLPPEQVNTNLLTYKKVQICCTMMFVSVNIQNLT